MNPVPPHIVKARRIAGVILTVSGLFAVIIVLSMWVQS